MAPVPVLLLLVPLDGSSPPLHLHLITFHPPKCPSDRRPSASPCRSRPPGTSCARRPTDPPGNIHSPFPFVPSLLCLTSHPFTPRPFPALPVSRASSALAEVSVPWAFVSWLGPQPTTCSSTLLHPGLCPPELVQEGTVCVSRTIYGVVPPSGPVPPPAPLFAAPPPAPVPQFAPAPFPAPAFPMAAAPPPIPACPPPFAQFRATCVRRSANEGKTRL